MVLASGFYGLFVVGLSCFAQTRLRGMFSDFKIDLPTSTQMSRQLSRLIWSDHAWVILVPFMFGWPLAVIPFLPAPQQPQSRVAVARATRYLMVALFFLTAVAAVGVYFLPMIALLRSVSGPQKD
jgi:hypothetical protein